jgi:hypothetical protein
MYAKCILVYVSKSRQGFKSIFQQLKIKVDKFNRYRFVVIHKK